jgi:hypothetical protein
VSFESSEFFDAPSLIPLLKHFAPVDFIVAQQRASINSHFVATIITLKPQSLIGECRESKTESIRLAIGRRNLIGPWQKIEVIENRFTVTLEKTPSSLLI